MSEHFFRIMKVTNFGCTRDALHFNVKLNLSGLCDFVVLIVCSMFELLLIRVHCMNHSTFYNLASASTNNNITVAVIG